MIDLASRRPDNIFASVPSATYYRIRYCRVFNIALGTGSPVLIFILGKCITLNDIPAAQLKPIAQRCVNFFAIKTTLVLK